MAEENKINVITKKFEDLVKAMPELRGWQLREKTTESVTEFFTHILEYAKKNNLFLVSHSDGFYVFMKLPASNEGEEIKEEAKSKKK